jgi:lipid-A-disaccharide synthase-like uncharacterized protein
MDETIGIIGLALLLAGWAFELYRTVKAGKAGISLGFAGLYFAGSFLLAYYALLQDDAIFLALNAAAGIIALINAYYVLRGGKKQAAKAHTLNGILHEVRKQDKSFKGKKEKMDYDRIAYGAPPKSP